MKYYIVTAKCGHVGRNKYILIEFPVIAENGEDAARKARMIPRVKHDHKDAIRMVKQVDYDSYCKRWLINASDDYLKCKCKQEQKLIQDLGSRILMEDKVILREKNNDNKWFHKTRVRNYKKYLLNYIGV